VRRAFALGLVLLGVVACRRDKDTTSAFPRHETLYIGGPQWGEASSFNPLASSPDWPLKGMNLMYETLLVFDSQQGEMKPLLAESYRVTDEAVEVTLHEEARFSDGSPVTARDVKYTFDLGRRFKSLLLAPVWQFLTDVRVADGHPRKVVFALNPERLNPLVVLDSLQETYIVPAHVIEPLLVQSQQDINRFLKLKLDAGAVASGPYRLHSHSTEKIVAVRRDDYWGNQVFFGGKAAAPKYIVHPLYKSNDHYSVALQQGRLDASSTFVPRIWLKHKKGVKSWYDTAPFFVPASIPTLFVNHLKKPLDDVHLRRAMAFSIDYDDIRELAVSGYSEPLRPGLVLPFGVEKKYYSEQDAKKYGAGWHDPERAKAELRKGGYRSVWDDDGDLREMRDASGKRVPTLFVKSPSGWTDWESVVRIAVRSMRAVGIDARERFIDASLFWNAVFGGDFDLIMFLPSPAPTPSKPWSRFETILTSREWVPIGDKTYKNMGRFNKPGSPGYVARFDELLDSIPTLKDEKALREAYRELNALFMRYQPAIPLVYRPDQFYEFSSRAWTGFPTSEHPFLPPNIPGVRLGTRILWHLEPASAVN
jgi:peptide/nickel transport system substrate-binding protein